MNKWIRLFLLVLGGTVVLTAAHEMGHVWIARHKDHANVTEVCFLGVNFAATENRSWFNSPIGWTEIVTEEEKNLSKWHDYWDLGLEKYE